MAQKYLMTWVPAVKRWAKWYRGKSYAISCKQLNCPETKEASWRQANEWWQCKKTELDANQPQPQPHPFQADVNLIAERVQWAEENAPNELPKLLELHKEAATKEVSIIAGIPQAPLTDNVETIARRMQEFEAETGVMLPDLEWDTIAKFFGSQQVWEDRLERQPLHSQGNPDSDTIGAHAKRFLDKARLKHATKAGTFGQLKIHLDHFVNCPNLLSPKTPVKKVNESLIESYYVYVATEQQAGRLSDETAKNRLLTARRFIRYLWELRLIELPRNLDSKDLKIKVRTKAIKLPTLETVQTVLAETKGQLKLYLLLMLNCGMYQTDIAALKRSEIDWSAGTITRKRTKTADHKSSPTITYPLWAETLELLKTYDSGEETVLLSERGTKLLEQMHKEDGTSGKKDLIQLQWKRWNKSKKHPVQLKQLRKFSASLLDNHPAFGRYAQTFLGHAPRSIAEKHYVQPSETQFRKALTWLHKQIFKG